jgi:hypothetical protein
MSSSRMRLFVALGIAILAGVVFVVVWFEPQQLLVDTTVSESLEPTPSGSPALGSGAFRSLEHETRGTAALVRTTSGKVVLRFEDLDTSSGPDLRVYLSKKPATLGWRDYGDDYLELGPLKANHGDQNYTVPAGTDLTRYRSAVIWCVRFKVGFGVAPLDA